MVVRLETAKKKERSSNELGRILRYVVHQGDQVGLILFDMYVLHFVSAAYMSHLSRSCARDERPPTLMSLLPFRVLPMNGARALCVKWG